MGGVEESAAAERFAGSAGCDKVKAALRNLAAQFAVIPRYGGVCRKRGPESGWRSSAGRAPDL